MYASRIHHITIILLLQVFISLLYIEKLAAQSHYLDSLETVLKNHPQKDTIRCHLLIELAVRNVYPHPEKAQAFATEALSLSKNLNDEKSLASAFQIQASIHLIQGRLKEALEYFNQSISLASQTKESWGAFQLASSKGDLGSIAVYNNDYTEGIKLYMESEEFFEKENSVRSQLSLHALYQNIYSLYDVLGDTLNERYYLDQAFKISKSLNDSGLLIWDTKMYISMLLKAGKVTEAAPLIENFKQLYTELGDGFKEEDYHYLTGLYYREKKEYEKAVIEFANAAIVAEKYKNKTALTTYEYYQADVWLHLLKPKLAKPFAISQLNFGQQNHDFKKVSEAYGLLSRVAEAEGNTALALEQYKLSVQYQDSVNFVSQQRQILFAQAHYDAEKRQVEIKQLQTEKQQQQLTIKRSSLLAIIMAATTLMMLIIYLLLRRNSGQKQLMQQRKIQELETEKKLSTTEALLKGEEQERRRLAKDLHDGLGGSLSGIKYALGNMKQNVVMTPENHQSFERTIDMLDASIQELRRVAHNMMPESLLRFGLDVSLKDFCTDVNSSGIIKTVYQSYNINEWLPEASTSITLYRIVQELVNNVIKHAGAKQVIIQLLKENNRLSITVEDDGQGFDTNILSGGKGMGWSNITSRVEYLKGETEIHSTLGKGTSISINIPL